VKGDLKLGIIPTVSPYLVPLFINTFNSYHPQVNVNVQEEITEEVISKIKNGELDAGIIATPIESKGILTFPLYYERFFAYIAAGHNLFHQAGVSQDDLMNNELWLLKEGNCFRDQVLNLCNMVQDQDFKSHFRYESHSIEALMTIVEVKHGMTLIPELALHRIKVEKESLIKPITDINPVREIS
jgi:LysR family hydrogen peroxide-inducible transcriptional activator